jgi:hypothetical protein
MVANLDFKTEFKAQVTLIQSTWIGVDTKDVRAALLDAFNAGLHDGRFWCDQYINYRVGAEINEPYAKHHHNLPPRSLADYHPLHFHVTTNFSNHPVT